MVKPSPVFSILLQKVPCGQSSAAAVIWAVWLQSSSMACLPKITKSAFSSKANLARILET
ncbi:hypothetical protein CVS40_0224 [Lucilia cuprina]|nr:hypothetical protein CVS40_0224 [Lucilia cuprina]